MVDYDGGDLEYLGFRRFQDGSRAEIYLGANGDYWADIGQCAANPGLRSVVKTTEGFRLKGTSDIVSAQGSQL